MSTMKNDDYDNEFDDNDDKDNDYVLRMLLQKVRALSQG